MPDKTYTKESLIAELIKIRNMGWIEQKRNIKNVGSIGNTLEDLLGIKENNLPLPNASEWELKTQRKNTSSLLTLFHMEPSPTALKIVPYLLEKYGWRHKEAGGKYPDDELSFRQTLSYHSPTVRGFDLSLDEINKKVIVTFDPDKIAPSMGEWKKSLISRDSLHLDLSHSPYWGFNDLYHKAGTKLKNCFFVVADTKRVGKSNYIYFEKILLLSNFVMENMVEMIKSRYVYVDFDARTGHNHGTKFRIKSNAFPDLYENVLAIE